MAEPDHLATLPRVAEEMLDAASLSDRLNGAIYPFVVRNIATDWPMVDAGRISDEAVRQYLLDHRRNRPFPTNIGRHRGEARLFYDDRMAMNFDMANLPLEDALSAMARAHGPDGSTVYLSSIDMEDYFVGLTECHMLPLGQRKPLKSIWIGTPTVIAAHMDVPDNIAVCVAGKRRFVLFPPDQYPNLYLGPLDNTPAGRAVSMVDLKAPDFEAYPRFRAALENASLADLEPGDMLFIPSMWWHHVEATAPFNILVNYWWRDCPAYLGNPEDALLHAILAIRDLPDYQKSHWQKLFGHYVFGDCTGARAHIPDDAQGVLAPLKPETAGRLRSKLLRGLSR